MTPFFSIVVVCLNAESTIARTVSSILLQTFEDYEIIVKDGLSTDTTLVHVPHSEKVRIFQQADIGVYDAMNQAISHCKGRYICFLNCGDVFLHSTVLQEVHEVIERKDEQSEPVVFYGDYMRKDVVFSSPRDIYDFYLYRTPLNHQTMFYSSELFRSHGGYNTKYKILADYEHTLRIYRAGAQFVYTGVTSIDYLGGGLSEAAHNTHLAKREYHLITAQYFTKQQLLLYRAWFTLSLQGVRALLVSDGSPKLVRTCYRFIVNKINQWR